MSRLSVPSLRSEKMMGVPGKAPWSRHLPDSVIMISMMRLFVHVSFKNNNFTGVGVKGGKIN